MTTSGVNTQAPIDPAVLEQVRTLAADRQRLELWIAGIDRASVEAPSHVRERVRADYVQRHATVDGQLRAHVIWKILTYGAQLIQSAQWTKSIFS